MDRTLTNKKQGRVREGVRDIDRERERRRRGQERACMGTRKECKC